MAANFGPDQILCDSTNFIRRMRNTERLTQWVESAISTQIPTAASFWSSKTIYLTPNLSKPGDTVAFNRC